MAFPGLMNPYVSLYCVLVIASIVYCSESLPVSSLESENLFTNCSSCTDFVTKLQSELSDNKTLTHYYKILELACVTFAGPKHLKECKDDARSIVLGIRKQDKSFEEEYTPRQSCQLLSLCSSFCCGTSYWPQEVHLAYTASPSSVYIMWVTQLLAQTPTVRYGLSSGQLSNNKIGFATTYTKGGWVGHIYAVQLTNLQADTVYYYQVGDPSWLFTKNIFKFKTSIEPNTMYNNNDNVSKHRTKYQVENKIAYTFAMFGDMGHNDISDPTINSLLLDKYTHGVDLILHAGDISYADGIQNLWDIYMIKMESLTASIPYMLAPGNHETFFNFTAYRKRFIMPNTEFFTPDSTTNTVTDQSYLNSMYYSFNYGKVHIVAINFEQYLGLALDLHKDGKQYKWLENDLKEANNNRDKQSWIIVFAHRPVYCTTTNNHDKWCGEEATYFRNLVEPLFKQYKVDLYVSGHVHNYERTYPVYNNVTSSFNFDNAASTVYIVSGAAGNHEGLEGSYATPPPSWSIPSSRIAQYGYGLLDVHLNETLTWSFYRSNDHTLLDSFSMSKNN